MKTKWIDCDCNNPDHAIRFTYFENDEDYEDFLYVDVRPSPYKKFFSRLIIGIQYIFGFEKNMFFYQDSVLSMDKAEEIKNLIEERLEYRNSLRK